MCNRKKTKSNHNKEKENPPLPIIFNDEYTNLASFTPNKIIQKKKSNNFIVKRTPDTKDFRIKWKTEICHYWEMHGECKYGDNVRTNMIYFFLVRLRSWL